MGSDGEAVAVESREPVGEALHDLVNLLGVIANYVTLAQRTAASAPADATLAGDLEAIESAAREAIVIVRRLSSELLPADGSGP